VPHQADLCLGLAFGLENLAPFIAQGLHTPAGAGLDAQLAAVLTAYRTDALLKRSIATSLGAFLPSCVRVLGWLRLWVVGLLLLLL
jgi:hypothetical protein